MKENVNLETLETQYRELRAWLIAIIQWFENTQLGKSQSKLGYSEYLKFRAEFEEKKLVYQRMKETRSIVGVNQDVWREINSNWKTAEAKGRHWIWKLDTSLPGDFKQVSEI